MRQMARIVRIDTIRAIDGADSIECARIGGWEVVVKRDEFTMGNLAVYCEIDSWIPNALAPFLSKGSKPREYMGISGERLRTVKLRGQLSQGLLLPCQVALDKVSEIQEGQDVSELLGIVKYEAPISAQLAGLAKGMFPSFIRKTDQERIQNLSAELGDWKFKRIYWEVTEKLDGSSCTMYVRDGEFGVCSRNLDLKQDDTNTFWKMAIQYGVEQKLRAFGSNIAIQGEVVGESIQGNKYKLKGQKFFIFDIFNIDGEKYWESWRRIAWAQLHGFDHVPVLDKAAIIKADTTIQDLLISAEGASVLGDNNAPEREGLVYKSIYFPDVSFKAISNKFLLHEKG